MANMTGSIEDVAPVVPSLSQWRKVALASGDLGLNLYWQSITYFLLFFYTDVIGLNPVWAGLIYMAASIFDGIMDPIAGYFMDKSQTRWGRYRPWIVIGAVPLALSFMMLYWSPSLTGTLLVVFVTAAHMLFRICYTIVAVPMASLSASVVRDSRERTSLTGMRIMFALAGGVVVATCTRPLGKLLSADEATGFFWVAALSGCAATIIYAIVAWNVREQVETVAAERARYMPVSARSRTSAIAANRAFLALVGGLLGATLAVTIVSKSIVYYFKYVVRDEGSGSLALIVITTSSFLSVPLWTICARRYGKRAIWLTAAALGVCGLTLMALLRPVDAATTIALYTMLQVATAGIGIAYWATLPDTVEYGEWRTGLRLEAFLVGLFMFVQKFGLGVAAGIFGWMLNQIGVVHGQTIPPSLATNLPLVVVACAGAGFALSGLCAFLTPLRNGVHERIVAELYNRAQSPERHAKESTT